MSGASAFNLLFDPKALNAQRYTIAEGLDLRHILPIISKATGLKRGRPDRTPPLQPELLGLPSWASSVSSRRGLPLPGDVRPEEGDQRRRVLRSMVARFNTEATS